jgi:UDP-N-acetyl-D-mannosaminuronic acid transferase (WecB/TagA/CpsF family)
LWCGGSGNLSKVIDQYKCIIEAEGMVLLHNGVLYSEDRYKKISVISVEPQKIVAAMDEKQCVDMLYKEVKAIHNDTKGLVISLNPSDDEISKATLFAKDSDVIILGVCSGIIFKKQSDLYNALNSLNKTLIVVAMESPCDIEYMQDVKNYVATYGVARDWMKVAAKGIFGEIEINAKPAVDIKY